MSKKRKMDVDDKKKAFILGVAFMMLFIIIYFTFIHPFLGGEAAPWQLVDSIIALGTVLSFGLGLLITKLRMGEAHSVEEAPKNKRKFDE